MLSVTLFVGGRDETRVRNFTECMNCIAKQKYRNYEVILMEQIYDKQTRPKYYLMRLNMNRYIKVQNTLPEYYNAWNAGWLLNIAARYSSGDTILQLDGDMVFDDKFFTRINRASKKYKAFICWDKLVRLNEVGTEIYLKTSSFKEFENKIHKDALLYLDTKYGKWYHSPSIRCAAGGAVCFNRNFYFSELGGRNEWYMHRGGSDNDISIRWSKLLGRFYTIKGTIYHLYHIHGTNPKFVDRHKLLMETERDPMGVCRKIIKAGVGRLDNPTLFRRG